MYFKKKASLAVLLSLLLFFWACPLSSPPPGSKTALSKAESGTILPDPIQNHCQDIIVAWISIEGFPYVWGGESIAEGGFDCSGAIYHVQKTINRPVPRTTAKKYYLMASGEDIHWLQADCGDWIWWQFKPTRPYGHIGMHVKQPNAWQSGSSTGPTEIKMAPDNFWDQRFKASKRPRGK